MLGEGSPGLWFFARNSGKNLREKEPSGSLPTSCGRPLRLLTSLDLLAEARAKRRAVLRERSFSEAFFKGSYGACLKEVRTKNRSQAGCLRGDLASPTTLATSSGRPWFNSTGKFTGLKLVNSQTNICVTKNKLQKSPYSYPRKTILATTNPRNGKRSHLMSNHVVPHLNEGEHQVLKLW